mmetsp:Transcript_13475/g.32836  ORF Transcript_13475/g.32836 Transcript_13475/m.32836 type:complete len:543 (+) Transcript_13475:95-1723(+)
MPYDENIFGPFPEAVVPIQGGENGRLLVKFNVYSTSESRNVIYAVVEFDETNQNDGVVDGIVTNTVEYSNSPYNLDDDWLDLERIHDDFLIHNHPELGLELTPDPEILQLTKDSFTGYDGTMVPIHSDDDGNDDSETMPFLLYKLVVVDWPQVRIDIYRIVHDSNNGNGIFEDGGRIDFEDDGVVLLASTTITLDKPATTQFPDCSYRDYNSIDISGSEECSWYDGDDPMPLLCNEWQKNIFISGVFYYYSPKLDRLYVYYVWPLIRNIPDYCNYRADPDELFMVSIYQFAQSVPNPSSASLFDSSSETTAPVPAAVDIESVQTAMLTNIESWPEDYFRWVGAGPRHFLRIYDKAQILRFSSPFGCDNWYNLYYDTDTVELIALEGDLHEPTNVQRSVDLERKIYYRPKFDYHQDWKSLCFEQHRYRDWCSVTVPWNITIEECYLEDPNTCIRTIRLDEKELFDKLVPLWAWPTITTDTTNTITIPNSENANDMMIDWIYLRDGSSSSNAATKALAAVAISVVLLSASIVTMWVKLRPSLQK